MANELFIGLKFGAALSGTFSTVLGSVQGTVRRLGAETDALRQRHDRLGQAMARALQHPTRNVGELRRQYERLGRTIDDLRAREARLSASLARGEALRSERVALRSQATETLATGGALLAPFAKSVQTAAVFEDRVKDIAITGELSPAQELALGKTIRGASLRYNQDQGAVATGVATLVAEGMDPAAAERQANLLAKSSTATRAGMEDLARMTVNFDKVLGVENMELAFNQAAKAGKQGSFELRDMAKWFPALGGMLKSLGVAGNEAVVNMASRLQIARRTAGSNDEAANNFKNFLSKLTSPDTQKDFKKLGVDLQARLTTAARRGLDPVEAGVTVIMEQMGKSAPGTAKELQRLSRELMAIKDPAERAAELQRRSQFLQSLGERAGLSQMFQDMQAMSYLLAEIQNRGDLKNIMDQTRAGKSATGKSVIDEDFDKRLAGSMEKFGLFKRQLSEIGIVLGNALLPPLTSMLESVLPLVQSFGEWAEANPAVVKGVAGLIAGLTLGKVAVIGLRYGFNLLMSPINGVRTLIESVGTRWTLLKGMWQAGRFAPFINVLKTLGRGFGAVWRFLVPFGKGIAMFFISPLKLAGKAVLLLGRALLFNPIGLFITALGIAAYLVWKHWDTIKAALLEGWQWIKGQATRFYDAGSEIIQGLVNGIRDKATAAKDAVMNLGDNVRSWFAEKLRIHSPSRVFMGFGQNISEGAAIGITNGSGEVRNAVQAMAGGAMPPALGSGRGMSVGGGITIHYSPTIHMAGGAGEDERFVGMLRKHVGELEAMIRRVTAQQARRAY